MTASCYILERTHNLILPCVFVFLVAGEGLDQCIILKTFWDLGQHISVLGDIRFPKLEFLVPVVNLIINRLHGVLEVLLNVYDKVITVLCLSIIHSLFIRQEAKERGSACMHVCEDNECMYLLGD